MLTDSWFIGAFGKWWRAGSIHPGWIEAMTNAKDAERCTAGILDVKTLDGLEGYDGTSFYLGLVSPPLVEHECSSLVFPFPSFRILNVQTNQQTCLF